MLKKILTTLLLGLVFTAKAAAAGVDYYLPYPGLLPDHPLYWLKMVRDRVQLLATTEKQAKAEKLLLYADKRLGAAWALIDGNKQVLGASTLTKAEKYLYQAVESGRDLPEFRNKLAKAIEKHREVLSYLKPKAGDGYSAMIDEMLARLEQYQKQFGLLTQVTEAEISVNFGADKVESEKVTAATVFTALEKLSREKKWEVITKDYDFGKMVESVDGVKNSKTKAWIFYVNGTVGDRAADKFELKAGDKVEWRYEAVKP